MKRTLFFHTLLCISLVAQGASSSKKNKKKRSHNFVIDIDKTQNTPDNQLVGTKGFASVFTQAVYGKPCDTKFCTPAIRQRLKYLQKHDLQTFHTLINDLDLANQAITHRSKKSQTKITRANSNVLNELISPEMTKQLIKSWKNSHQQQELQIEEHVIAINDHQETIETHEGTIATQNSNLQTTRYRLYVTIGTTILGIISTVITAWVTSSQC